MTVSEILQKYWFVKEFGGLKKALESTPGDWLKKELTPDTLAGYICLLLDVTDIEIRNTICDSIQNPSGKTIVVYNPSMKIFNNLFCWACWACTQPIKEIMKKA